MAITILIKFCGFIVHSKPKNMTLAAFPAKIPETRKIVFNFPSTPKIKGSSHEENIKIFDFLKNGSNDFDQILWVYSTFKAKQYDTIGFSRKNPWNWKNIFLIFFRLLKQGLNQLINLVQTRYKGFSCKYF